jgi:hypothetical protein
MKQIKDMLQLAHKQHLDGATRNSEAMTSKRAKNTVADARSYLSAGQGRRAPLEIQKTKWIKTNTKYFHEDHPNKYKFENLWQARVHELRHAWCW